jgi:hypothetical protein
VNVTCAEKAAWSEPSDLETTGSQTD